MARPRKTGLDYFSLDTHFDEDVEFFESVHGLAGLGFLIRVWQRVYGGKGWYLDFSDRRRQMFAHRNHLTLATIDDYLDTLFDEEIFDRRLYLEFQVLTSAGIQRRYRKICKDARRSAPDIAPELDLLRVSSEKTPVSSEETPGFFGNNPPFLRDLVHKGQDSKVKDSKGQDRTAKTTLRVASGGRTGRGKNGNGSKKGLDEIFPGGENSGGGGENSGVATVAKTGGGPDGLDAGGFAKFRAAFTDAEAELIDLEYYWNRVHDWADGKNVPVKNPVLLAKKFMKSDQADNQLVTKTNGRSKPKSKSRRRKETDVTAEHAFDLAARVAAKYDRSAP